MIGTLLFDKTGLYGAGRRILYRSCIAVASSRDDAANRCSASDARSQTTELLFTSANAFGFKRVVRDVECGELRLMHGAVEQGRQRYGPALDQTPLGYFHVDGPFGEAMRALAPRGDIAVVGLGVGAAAAYAADGQRTVFLEIDPDVVHIARSYFTFLSGSRGAIEVRVGDGLALLRAMEQERFAAIVVDAYDEQDVPTHFLQRDALALLLGRLSEGGALILAATDGCDAVAPTVATLAAEMGLAFATRRDVMTADVELRGERQTSRYVALALESATLAPLVDGAGWQVGLAPQNG